MTNAIVVEGLSKSYLIAHRDLRRPTTLRDALSEGGASLWRRLRGQGEGGSENTFKSEEFWALRDVSFEVAQGERMGIIGANGAGKSTLLKILSRVTEPTRGQVRIRGRVASLLEVGTGFHPELTGRENVFLNGAILGMRRSEIRRKFDEIVAFAEVERFLDTPVKRYSSGMYVRLAFAVAAHLDPEILIVDEVLAVGDARFQKKSLGKMEAAAKGGTTVVFVSHGMTAVKNLCHTAIVLENGESGPKLPVNSAIGEYLRFLEPDREVSFPLVGKDVVIEDFRVTQDGHMRGEYDAGQPLHIRIKFNVLRDVTQFRIGVILRSRYGEILLRSLLADWDPAYETLFAGKYLLNGIIPADVLVAGEYIIQIDCSRFGLVDYGFWEPSSLRLNVLPSAQYNRAHPQEEPFGVFQVRANWTLSSL